MKRLFIVSYLCLGFLGLFAQQGYDIQVKVDGFAATEAYLAYYFGEKQYIKDTVKSANGAFRFKGEEALDGGIYLVVLPPENQYFEIIIDKDQHFQVETDTGDFVRNMKIKGSEENRLFYEDMIFLGESRTKAAKLSEELKSLGEQETGKKAELKKELAQIDEQVKANRKSFTAKHPEMLYAKVLQSMVDPVVPEELQEDKAAAFYYYRDHYFKGMDFSDDRLLRTPIMYNRVNSYLENLTVKQPDSIKKSVDVILGKSKANDDVFQFFTVNLLNQYAKSKIMGMDAVYVHIVEQVYMRGEAWWADSAQVASLTERALAISPTVLGRTAPNFRIQDIAGNWKQLHGIPAKYTILYFWSYDCGHCQKITPVLAEAYQAYKDKDVALFAVSINGDVEVWKEKVKEYGLEDAINVQDHARRSGFDGKYDIRSTPRIFILDENKTIIAKQISVEQVIEVLNHEMGIEEKKAK